MSKIEVERNMAHESSYVSTHNYTCMRLHDGLLRVGRIDLEAKKDVAELVDRSLDVADISLGAAYDQPTSLPLAVSRGPQCGSSPDRRFCLVGGGTSTGSSP